MAIQNLRENFLYEKLPDAVISLDERGLIQAVIGGFQDRLEDLRAFSSKLRFFYTVGDLPETGNNAVLADVTSDQGIVFTRSLEIQDDTPPPSAPVSLNAWVAGQLNLDPTQFTNVRYGVDLLRQVDADTLGYLADTLGTILYTSSLSTDQRATQQELVTTWFPRLKIKGTVRSFEALGRILGFDDVKVTPLWARVSPRLPQDIGNPANDQDFAEVTQFPPQQFFGVDYDPLATRDGPFFNWQGTVSNVITDANYYEAVVNGFSPFITVDTIGSHFGTVTHPSTGSYALAGGDSYTKATVIPFGAGVRFDALVQGDAYNGLEVSVAFSGTGSLAVLSVTDQLSTIKYRSAFYDVALTADMDKVEEIFGANAVRQNTDLAHGSNTSDGTAISPFRPWVSGSIASVAGQQDFLTIVSTTAGTTLIPRHEALATDRELNFTELLAAGVAVAQAFEEVRPATRFPRRTNTGFLIDDKVPYAFYGTQAPLFTSVGTVGYSGTDTNRPLPQYDARIQLQISQLLDVFWTSIPGALYQVYFRPTLIDPFTLIATLIAPNTTTHFYYSTTAPTAFFDVSAPGGGPPGGFGPTPMAVLIAGFPINSVAASDPISPNIWHYFASAPQTNITLTGSYDFNAGTYYFNIIPDTGGHEVWAYYTLTSTEVVRGEPAFVTKDSGLINALDRPEDDWYGTHTDNELVDEFPWRRDIVGGGELVEIDTYFPYTSDIRVIPVDSECVFPDQTGAEYSIRAVKTTAGGTHMRYNVEARSTAPYVPGMLPIGYKGTFKDLSTLTPQQVYDLNTFTDAETLFNPGFALYHTGLVQGVLVADPPGFFSPHHRNSLVGWLPFNEHPEEPLQVLDHSPVDGTQFVVGVSPSDRTWDTTMGWFLTLEEGALISSSDIRNWGANQTVSFWFNGTGGSTPETVVSSGNISFDYNAGSILGYATVSGVRTLIGSAATGAWTFVYIRRSASQAVFGAGNLSASAVETALSNTFDAEVDGAQVVIQQSSGTVDVGIRDLRIWSIQKSQADMDLVRYHNPTPTVVNYPIGFMLGAAQQDRFGLVVLPNGWVTTDIMPAWVRRPSMAWVQRYDDMGRYTGEHRFKETGLGDGPPLPALYKLGCQYLTITGIGTTVASTGTGQLPGVNDLWLHDTTYGTYLTVQNGTGTLVAYGSGSVPWPADMVQTNPIREFIWMTGSGSLDGSSIFEVTAQGSSSATLNAARLAPARPDSDILVDPVYLSLFETGTYWTFTGSHSISGTLIHNLGTITIADLGVPQLTVTPLFFDFGTVNRNTVAYGTFTVQNTGDAPFAFTGGATVGNTTGTYFSLASGGSYSLGPGASTVATVAFVPVAGTFSYSGSVTFTASGNTGPVVVPIIGESVTPCPNWAGFVTTQQWQCVNNGFFNQPSSPTGGFFHGANFSLSDTTTPLAVNNITNSTGTAAGTYFGAAGTGNIDFHFNGVAAISSSDFFMVEVYQDGTVLSRSQLLLTSTPPNYHAQIVFNFNQAINGGSRIEVRLFDQINAFDFPAFTSSGTFSCL